MSVPSSITFIPARGDFPSLFDVFELIEKHRSASWRPDCLNEPLILLCGMAGARWFWQVRHRVIRSMDAASSGVK
ncbi:MAG: hypothetical protein ACYCSR_14925, partial [Thiomonas sp.]